MIEGYLPGLVRVDPVGVAPAEVVALAARCERLESVADAAAALRRETRPWLPWTKASTFTPEVGAALEALDAALVAAGATGKAGT